MVGEVEVELGQYLAQLGHALCGIRLHCQVIKRQHCGKGRRRIHVAVVREDLADGGKHLLEGFARVVAVWGFNSDRGCRPSGLCGGDQPVHDHRIRLCRVVVERQHLVLEADEGLEALVVIRSRHDGVQRLLVRERLAFDQAVVVGGDFLELISGRHQVFLGDPAHARLDFVQGPCAQGVQLRRLVDSVVGHLRPGVVEDGLHLDFASHASELAKSGLREPVRVELYHKVVRRVQLAACVALRMVELVVNHLESLVDQARAEQPRDVCVRIEDDPAARQVLDLGLDGGGRLQASVVQLLA
jgi:hypothetical protein